MVSERRPRRWRRRAFVAAGVALAVLVAGVGYGAWLGSDEAIKVRRWGPGDLLVLASVNGTVTLPDTPETRKPGTYWLEWSGAGTMLGEVKAREGGTVTRAVLDGPVPSTGTSVTFTSSPPGDPAVAWGVDFRDIPVETELGPAPAWYVPGDVSTWFIGVHGQNGRRNAVQKVLPVVHERGMPFLAITYRNDEGAPASPDGLIHMGDTEWRDLEAAVRAARNGGARRVVLYGVSLGGVVIGQFLARSPLAESVTGVIMDAPPYDMERVSEYNAARFGMPAFAGWLSSRVVEWRIGIDQDRLHLIHHPPKVRPPLLLLHTDGDAEVPVASSRELAAAGPRLDWSIRYEEFQGGGHTEAWNVDRQRYDRLVRAFLTEHA